MLVQKYITKRPIHEGLPLFKEAHNAKRPRYRPV